MQSDLFCSMLLTEQKGCMSNLLDSNGDINAVNNYILRKNASECIMFLHYSFTFDVPSQILSNTPMPREPNKCKLKGSIGTVVVYVYMFVSCIRY